MSCKEVEERRIISARKISAVRTAQVANHIQVKTRNLNRRSGLPSRGEKDDDSKMCPFGSADYYDADIHDALENKRRLDGSSSPQEKYGPPVNFFTPKGSRKYWISKRTPILGYMHYIDYSN